jgi:hypothetical protein
MIAQAIPVFNGAGQDVGDRFNPPMRVPGKTGEVILRQIISKIIQEQERIELGRVAEPESPAQTHPGTFQRRLRFN